MPIADQENDAHAIATAYLDGFVAAVKGPAFARQPSEMGARGLAAKRGFLAGSKCRGIVDGSEHGDQVALFRFLDLIEPIWPEAVRSVHAIPNGGKRGKLTAAKLKQEGVKPGIPDICVPVARLGYSSLRIELKREAGGRISPEQRKRAEDLQSLGGLVIFAFGLESAARAVVDYLWQPAS